MFVRHNMRRQCNDNMRKILLSYYFCLILIAFASSQNGNEPEMGPYRVSVTKSERCKVPPMPYEKKPNLMFSSEVYNVGKKSLLRGNLTVIKVNPNMRIQAKGYIIEDGKYRVIYLANAVGCHGVLIKVFKIALKVQNHKGCVPQGTYIFEDLDFNALQQMWSKSSLYGSFKWKLSIGTKTATTICWEYDTVSEPAK